MFTGKWSVQTLFSRIDRNSFSILSEEIITGGFNYIEDGSDVHPPPNPLPYGHRSIGIREPTFPVPLLHQLNELPWTKEPNQPNADDGVDDPALQV
jgi:hypothetical protein